MVPYNFLVKPPNAPHLHKPSTMPSICSIYSGNAPISSASSLNSPFTFLVQIKPGFCLKTPLLWTSQVVVVYFLTHQVEVELVFHCPHCHFQALEWLYSLTHPLLSFPSSFHIWASHSFFFLPAILLTSKPSQCLQWFQNPELTYMISWPWGVNFPISNGLNFSPSLLPNLGVTPRPCHYP